MISNCTSTSTRRAISGFSLLEIMIALALGLLLTAGILTVVDTTGRTNRLQDGLARLQESGRFAVTRMQADLRMLGGQYCSNRSGNAVQGSVAATRAGRAPMVFAKNLALPDSGGMNSVDANGEPSAAEASAPYALSPRFFMQGYACSDGAACVVPADIPAEGLDVGDRVPETDVLTIRYQRGSGWPITGGTCSGAGGDVTLARQDGDDEYSLEPDQLALISDCQNPGIVPVESFAGSVVKLKQADFAAGAAPTCTPTALRDMRLFNFSRDFVTVTYYLRFAEDPNPDVNPNTGAGIRLIPALVRQENGVAQELVQGVDLMVFRYGVQDATGATRYLTADLVDTRDGGTIACTTKPDGVAPSPAAPNVPEPGCLWRSVRSVEAHLLVNTVNEVHGLDTVSRSYRFVDPAWIDTTSDSLLPSGLMAGSMLRREFIAQTSVRNNNP